VNQPPVLTKVLQKLEAIQKEFNSSADQRHEREEGLAGRSDCSRRQCSRRGSCEKGRAPGEASFRAGVARMHRKSKRMCTPSRYWSRPQDAFRNYVRKERRDRWRSCCWIGRSC